MPIINGFLSIEKKIKRTVMIVFIAALFSVHAYAACPREDVSYFLKQGFNHEQIVQLCSTTGSSKETVEKAESKIKQIPPFIKSEQPSKPLVESPDVRHESAGIYGNPDAVFLATAIEAYDIEVTKNTIMFTRKDCFNFGQKDWNGFQNSACPNVKYTIISGGLQIKDRDNGFFGLGSKALYVSGNIRADILNLDQFKQNQQEEIRQLIQNNTKALKIDVRRGMPQDKVEAVFLRIAG
jgi:hypothetical protein